MHSLLNINRVIVFLLIAVTCFLISGYYRNRYACLIKLLLLFFFFFFFFWGGGGSSILLIVTKQSKTKKHGCLKSELKNLALRYMLYSSHQVFQKIKKSLNFQTLEIAIGFLLMRVILVEYNTRIWRPTVYACSKSFLWQNDHHCHRYHHHQSLSTSSSSSPSS